jgi:nitrite reductase/ring-hydroxylating ferredoxin subunit
MKKYTKSQIISRLEREGLKFSSFSLTHEGRYDVDDADWNYKDVPHLHFVHELAEGIPAVVGDDIVTSVNMQKVLWFRFPFAVTNYESGQNSQTYYTVWLYYVLIIETSYENVGHGMTRVVTTYSVGSPKWLQWTFPILKWILKRNYDNLMMTDVPMRLRKGELRSWGYTFRKNGARYSFAKTMDISATNVQLPTPSGVSESQNILLPDLLPNDGEYFLGRDDHLGIRIVRKNNLVSLFPRMCPHEGASLDSYKCSGPKEAVKGGVLRCPWHGRPFGPFATIDVLSEQVISKNSNQWKVAYSRGVLTVQFESGLG